MPPPLPDENSALPPGSRSWQAWECGRLPIERCAELLEHGCHCEFLLEHKLGRAEAHEITNYTLILKNKQTKKEKQLNMGGQGEGQIPILSHLFLFSLPSSLPPLLPFSFLTGSLAAA